MVTGTCAKKGEKPWSAHKRGKLRTRTTPVLTLQQVTSLVSQTRAPEPETEFPVSASPSKSYWLQSSKIGWDPAPPPWHEWSAAPISSWFRQLVQQQSCEQPP